MKNNKRYRERDRIAWILVILIFLAMIVAYVTASILVDSADAAEADPQCWHGCPPERPFKAFVANLQQCAGQFCGLFTAEPEPGR